MSRLPAPFPSLVASLYPEFSATLEHLGHCTRCGEDPHSDLTTLITPPQEQRRAAGVFKASISTAVDRLHAVTPRRPTLESFAGFILLWGAWLGTHGILKLPALCPAWPPGPSQPNRIQRKIVRPRRAPGARRRSSRTRKGHAGPERNMAHTS